MVDTYIFWDGASTPSGWTLVSDSGNDFYHKFPRGAATYGGTGGSTTHTAHSGSQTSGGAFGTNDGAYGGGNWHCEPSPHYHPAGSASVGTGSSLPSYRTLKTIKYVGIPTSLPAGAITIFDNTCPSGHTRYSSQDDKYIYCDSTIGTTGGNITHTHLMTGTLPYTPSCNSGLGFSPIVCPHTHTFTVTSGSGTYEPDWLGVILGKSGSDCAPPYSSILMFGANPGRPWNVVSKVGYPLYCRHIKPKASYGAYGSSRFHLHSSGSGNSGYGPTGGMALNITGGMKGTHRHPVTVTAALGNGGDPPYLDVIYARQSLSYPPKRKINGHTIDAINSVNSHTKTEMDKFTYRVWTAKAAFGGTSRGFAVGFALGDKFYLGTGYDLNAAVRDDFWVFDPSTNAWSQKADFGGASRNGAIGFALSGYGYIGLGYNGVSYLNDFWQYNPTGNYWSQKTNYGGGGRYCASSFALGSYGYAGLGDLPGPTNTWWRYDPTGNSWSQKANYGGSARDSASAFSIGSYSYVGCGWPASGVMVKDWWRYSENSWTQMADLTGYARFGAAGFSIGSDGYVVGGALHYVTGFDVRDAYKYSVSGNSWTGIADYGPSTYNLKYLVGVGLGTEGYVATGIQGELGSFAFSNANYELRQLYMAIS